MILFQNSIDILRKTATFDVIGNKMLNVER